ncbi:tubulin binding cofactor A [Mycena floridula]|nr:tubulin binding cofactor A [Mycena floridula]
MKRFYQNVQFESFFSLPSTFMSDIQVLQRQLKIKSGAAKRTYKEHLLYRSEVETNRTKLAKFQEDGTEEEWYTKNAIKLIEESTKMVDDSADRLAAVQDELQELVDSAKEKPELADGPELINAKAVLEEISA